MSVGVILLILLALSAYGYMLGRRRAVVSADGRLSTLHSVPSYYGFYVALWCGLPALFLVIVWYFFEPVALRGLVMAGLPNSLTQDKAPAQLDLIWATIQNIARGTGFGSDEPSIQAAADRLVGLRSLLHWAETVLALALAIACLAWARQRIVPNLRARNKVERTVMIAMVAASTIAILTTLGIVVSLIFESLRFFARFPVTDFLFGLQWSPQTAIREDQVGSSGAFGAIPVFAGTFLISLIAMCVAVPIGLLTAIYLADYAPKRVRASVKPIVEILAGIPTVVYGFFAVLTVAPFMRELGGDVGLDVSANSALAAGVVMGIMIIPFVSSLSDDVINSVPQTLRDGAYALGATRSETVRQIILPAALPGIVGAVLLAVSRAIGETMIVVMAAGLSANLTANPFEAVTTVTVQIVSNLTGDTEFDSAKTLSAFALGLVLFAITLVLNVIALRIVQKYREKYD
ncbi:MAG: phosphate ABC transporter permease subunit PstC [Deinococcus-Thermus bacterium]|jgi:phosphate transport system permease protein|nr:phosphate ABC transporter permease subunit PstC [Deinococcota bacterium]